MNCPTCRDLERAYEAAFSEYIEACSSASFSVSSKAAASKNVDMERTRYELEEHRRVCVTVSEEHATVATAEQVYEDETLVA
jgi:RNA-splicing ligase RtcB